MQNKKYTWVFGDIHGMDSALKTLYKYINDNYGISKLIFLGDYIDRGDKSKQVIDFLIELKQKCIFLIGNHEQVLLDIFSNKFNNKKGKAHFYAIGGRKTVDSFGYNNFNKFIENIDHKYISFLSKLKYSHTELIPKTQNQKIFFIHAGIVPDVNFNEQISIQDNNSYHEFIERNKLAYDKTFLWIRKNFFQLDSNSWNNNLIIHGHTPVHLLKGWFEKPSHINFKKKNTFSKSSFLKYAKFNDSLPFFRLKKNSNASRVISIDLDTGAAYNKKLTAIGLDLLNTKNNKIPAKIIQANVIDNKIIKFSTDINLY